MAPVTAHWRQLELAFDAVYTGFMGSARQIGLTAAFLDAFCGKGRALAVVDPVMGDHGRPYRTYTPQMCRAMGELADRADVIVPNATEAALLLGVDWEQLRLDRAEDCRRWARALSLDGRRSVVLTGTALTPDAAGAVCYDRDTGAAELVSAPLAPGEFHGTGDLFASVLAGALVRGMSLVQGAQLAADFTSQCAARTGAQDLPRREGVDFEPLLWRLGQAMASDENRRTIQ